MHFPFITLNLQTNHFFLYGTSLNQLVTNCIFIRSGKKTLSPGSQKSHSAVRRQDKYGVCQSLKSLKRQWVNPMTWTKQTIFSKLRANIRQKALDSTHQLKSARLASHYSIASCACVCACVCMSGRQVLTRVGLSSYHFYLSCNRKINKINGDECSWTVLLPTVPLYHRNSNLHFVVCLPHVCYLMEVVLIYYHNILPAVYL